MGLWVEWMREARWICCDVMLLFLKHKAVWPKRTKQCAICLFYSLKIPQFLQRMTSILS